jgi:hypothetical protein
MELTRGGGRGEEIVIVNVTGNVRRIMVLAGFRIEGFKGDMCVHRWWLRQRGRMAKAEVAVQGGWPLSIIVDGC